MHLYNNVFEMLERGRRLYPNKKYIFFEDKVYTYKEAYEKVLHTGNVLRSQGVKKGDRVIIFLGNCPEYIFAYFGIIYSGAIAVPTNYFLKTNELMISMKDCSAGYIITSEEHKEVMEGIFRRVPSLKKIFSYGPVSFEALDIDSFEEDTVYKTPVLSLNGVAALIYTSGTTGFPKGVMLTHKNILANARSFSIVLGCNHKYRYLAVLPLFHSYSFMVNVMGPLYDNGSVIILASVTDMQKKSFKKTLIFKRPNVFTGVPQIYSALAKKKLSFFQRLIMPVKYYISGGAPLPEDTVVNFRASYGKGIIEGYGLSEAAPIVALNPLDYQKVGTVGHVFYGGEVKVVNPDGKELGVDEVGELCYKGDNVMKGYWNQPEETAKVLREGWLSTGDLAKIDSEGYISIVGRLKELIICKGMNVYPREIEELLYMLDSVNIAAVVGIPDVDGSEIIVAFVKPDDGAQLLEKDLRNYIKKNVANYKVPRYFVITDDMPVNAGGKVVKKDLKQIALKLFNGK